eukprot:8341053-Lingulodinium_polyedra.AAC.1
MTSPLVLMGVFLSPTEEHGQSVTSHLVLLGVFYVFIGAWQPAWLATLPLELGASGGALAAAPLST